MARTLQRIALYFSIAVALLTLVSCAGPKSPGDEGSTGRGETQESLPLKTRPGWQEDLALEVVDLSGGQRKVVTAFPHYLLGRQVAGAWLPPGSQTRFLHSYLYEGEIWRVT